MALDVETLLAPVSEEQPAGADLSYDNDRAALEQVFESSESANPADAATDDRDWRTTLKLIESQFARTKDVWLATYLCRAGARSGSLELVETGAQVLAGLFEQYWPTVHPQLEELGLPGRKAPCDALAQRGGFLAPLEKTIVLAHPRLGAFSGADLERFRVQGDAAEGYGMFRAALQELGEDSLSQAMAKLQSIEDGLRRADRVFTAEAAGEQSPNFAPTYAVLTSLQQSVRAFLAEPVLEVEAEDETEAAAGEGEPGAGGGSKKSFGGAVNSRQDVVRALTAVADYYRTREPSHPVLFLIARAQGWIELDFMSLLRDIAPTASDQAEGLFTSRSQP